MLSHLWAPPFKDDVMEELDTSLKTTVDVIAFEMGKENIIMVEHVGMF